MHPGLPFKTSPQVCVRLLVMFNQFKFYVSEALAKTICQLRQL